MLLKVISVSDSTSPLALQEGVRGMLWVSVALKLYKNTEGELCSNLR